MSKKLKKGYEIKAGMKLGAQEQRLYDALTGRAFASIPFLFVRVAPKADKDVPSRLKHQKVGAVAARFNKKRAGQRIVPGDIKGTYKLVRVRASQRAAVN